MSRVLTLSERDQVQLDESTRRRAANQKRRNKREKQRELRKQYRDQRNSNTSISEQRQLKKDFEAALLDIETDSESNKIGDDSSVQEDGIDNVDSGDSGNNSSDGGGIPDGYSEISATICINGSPTSGTILFKT